jgi:hypothetical protein
MAVYNGVYLQERGGRDSEGVPFSLVPIAPPRITYDGEWRLDGQVIDGDSLLYIPRASWPTVTGTAATVVRLARDVIAAAWAQQAYSADFWQAGGAPVVYIKTEQPLTSDEAGAIRDAYATARSENPGKPAVIGKGGDIKTLGADVASEGSGSAGDREDRAIAQYLGVPAWVVNVAHAAGSLVYQNAGAAGLDLVRYNLQPGYSGPIADAWSEFLPGGYITGRRVHIGLEHLTRGTQLEQAQMYAIATGAKAWMLPSEVRNDLMMPIDMTLDADGTPAPAIESIPEEANV